MLSSLASTTLVFVWLWFLLKRLFDPAGVQHGRIMFLNWLLTAGVHLVQDMNFWLFNREFTPATIGISIGALATSVGSLFVSYHMRRFTGLSIGVLMASLFNFAGMIYYAYA